MDPIGFYERDALNGRRVRIVIPYEEHPHLTDAVGVIAHVPRVPRFDHKRKPYQVLPVLIDGEIVHIGVERLDFVTEEES
jgi:hypothetical protein